MKKMHVPGLPWDEEGISKRTSSDGVRDVGWVVEVSSGASGQGAQICPEKSLDNSFVFPLTSILVRRPSESPISRH